MNLGNLNVHSVQYNLPRLNHSTSRHSIAASTGEASQSEAGYATDAESVTTAETVVRWDTLPRSRQKSLEDTKSSDTILPKQISTTTNIHEFTITNVMRELVEDVRGGGATASQRAILDDFDSAPPTPDNDDAPYIRNALDMITGDVPIRGPWIRMSEESYPVDRIVHDEGLGYVQSVKKVKVPALVDLRPKISKFDLFIPVEPSLDLPRYPALTFMPTIIRPFSMIMIMFLCSLMIGALMFCAIYSMNHDGFLNYGGLYSGQYFLFEFLPQILATILLSYVERILSAVSRMVPFTMMASDNSRRRSNALFVDLYPRSFILPRFDYLRSGETLLGMCSILLWPLVFTIPLQSSLFSVIPVDGAWRWTAVRGVAWTLVAIYILALVSLMGIGLYFFRKSTGLIWDPRSLADLVALLSRSNILDQYQDTEVLAGKRELRARLAVSSERLGYWRTNNASQEAFYCIGEEGAPTRRYTMQDGKAERKRDLRLDEEKQRTDVEAPSNHPYFRPRVDSFLEEDTLSEKVRFRYIPWFFNDTFVLLWPIAAFFLVLALIIISFLPSTALQNGFLPLVPAAPDSAGFSSANFLYSFVPSLLGMLIYFSFKTLSLTLRQLAPWTALSNPDGTTASHSLLLDYTASFPLLTSFTNNHHLVALFTALAPLTILLPILAGGLFFPIQETPTSSTVIMLPNLPAFYIIIAILILCVIALIVLAISFIRPVGRRRHRLPHPVDCLAEIISFLYASSLVHDAAFRDVRSKADLSSRLVGRRERGTGGQRGKGGQEVRYAFGVFQGRDGRTHLGVERVKPEEERMGGAGGGGRGHGRSQSRFSV